MIWVMSVTLPVQGMAAAYLLKCDPAHRHAPGPAAMPVDHVSHGHALHDGEQDLSHARMASHIDAADFTGAAQPAGASAIDTPPHHAGHKCSACASCCSGCALLGAQVVIGTPEHAGGFIAAPLIRFARVAVDGPERPPRASRA